MIPCDEYKESVFVWNTQDLLNDDSLNDSCFAEYFVHWREDILEDEISVLNENQSYKFLIGQPNWPIDLDGAFADYLDSIITFLDDPANAWALGKDWVFDVESYLLDEWDADENAVFDSFIQMLEVFETRMGPRASNLIVTVPFHYDLDQMLAVNQIADEIIIMSYRDVVSSDDSNDTVLGLIEPYIDQFTKPYRLALETVDIDPDKVTFFEEGRASLLNAIQEIYQHYDVNVDPNFNGLSLHHLQSFRDLRE